MIASLVRHLVSQGAGGMPQFVWNVYWHASASSTTWHDYCSFCSLSDLEKNLVGKLQSWNMSRISPSTYIVCPAFAAFDSSISPCYYEVMKDSQLLWRSPEVPLCFSHQQKYQWCRYPFYTQLGVCPEESEVFRGWIDWECASPKPGGHTWHLAPFQPWGSNGSETGWWRAAGAHSPGGGNGGDMWWEPCVHARKIGC